MDERELLRQLNSVATRRKAFAVLVQQYSEKLYWTIRHIVGRHEDADDALQNTFLKIWNKLDEFRGDAQLTTWIHRIAVNEALDLLRREKRFAGTDIDASEVQRSFSDEYFDGDEAETLLREAIETLPEAQRAVFTLKYYENMPYKEISIILGTTEGGLKANYHHAVEKIKQYIDKKK